MRASEDQIRSGMLGLLVGDACGVPYEFRSPAELPPADQIEMIPPKGFIRTYEHVRTGTWSDDGAQALCLFASLRSCGHYHPHDFASRLVQWYENGYMAVDGYVFDIGNQTSESILRLRRGWNTSDSGLCGVRNNGNGSLMRSLPLALLHPGNDVSLVVDAHRQSRLTHGHIRSQVCCALFCLWARRELQGHSVPWQSAIATLRGIYRSDPVCLRELNNQVEPESTNSISGTSYVVDSLKSAYVATRETDFRSIIRKAISFGNDTDTTACVAGGIAGIRHGLTGIPPEWVNHLRGKEILQPLGVGPTQSVGIQTLD